MSHVDDTFADLVAANPAPTQAATPEVVWTAAALLRELDARSIVMDFEQLTKDPTDRRADDGPPTGGGSTSPSRGKPRRAPWLLAAATIAVIALAINMLTGGGDDEAPLDVVTDSTPTPEPAVDEPEPAEDAAEDAAAEAEAAAEAAEAAAEAEAVAAEVEVAVEFIEARNNYNADAAFALLAPNAGMRDEFFRDGERGYLSYDDISQAEVTAWEQLTGTTFVDPDCSSSSPGRVRCEYSWENDWSRALGDNQYEDSVMLLDMRDGQITYVGNTLESPWSLLPIHTFDVFAYWATWVNDSGATVGDLVGDQNAVLRTPEAFALMEQLAPVFLAWLNETWTCDTALLISDHPDEPALFCD